MHKRNLHCKSSPTSRVSKQCYETKYSNHDTEVRCMQCYIMKLFPLSWLLENQNVIRFLTSFIFELTIAGEDMASPALNNSKLILKEREML